MTDFPLQVISWGIFPQRDKAWFLTSRIFHESVGCKGGNMQGHTVGQVLDMGHLHGHTPPLLCPALSSRLLAFMNCTQGFPCLLASTELTSRGSRRNGKWEERKEDSPLPGQSSAPLPKLLWESSLGSGNLFFLLPLQAQKWSVSLMLAQVLHLPLLVFCNPAFTFVNMFWH